MARQKRRFKFLTVGSQSKKRFELLLTLVRVETDSMRGALDDFLVKGIAEGDAVVLNGVAQSSFNRKLGQLDDAASTVESIKELDWAHLKNS